MALSDVKTDGSWIKTFDEKGKHISTMSSSGKDVVGIGSDSLFAWKVLGLKLMTRNVNILRQCQAVERLSVLQQDRPLLVKKVLG